MKIESVALRGDDEKFQGDAKACRPLFENCMTCCTCANVTTPENKFDGEKCERDVPGNIAGGREGRPPPIRKKEASLVTRTGKTKCECDCPDNKMVGQRANVTAQGAFLADEKFCRPRLEKGRQPCYTYWINNVRM